MLSDLIFRFRSLFRRSAVENELDDELQFHVEQQVEKLVRSGLTRQDALRQTRLEFGAMDHVKEDCRESRGITFLETTARDIRYALRQLSRTPAFTITVLLTLALGIGANAAIFTLVNAVLLKKLPVADPGSLVRLGDNNDCCVGSGNRQDGDFAMFSTDTYQQLKKNAPEFEELAAMQAGFWGRTIIARRDGTQVAARSVAAEFVSGNYFRTFALQARAGRLLMDADDTQGAPTTAVMSFEAWQRNYAGDASVVGSTFWINTKPVTVVGIVPEGFYGDRMSVNPAEFYLPIEAMPVLANSPYVHDPEEDWLYIIGRIKPGVAIAPLQKKVTALLQQALATNGEFSSEQGKRTLAKVRVVLTPGGAGIQAMQEWYGSKLHLLMGIAGLVLLIACANVANLLLVRGMARRAEISMRAALGAMRGRIIRQLLTESIVLAGMGGIAGLGVAYAGARMLLMLAFPGAENIPIHTSPSLSVLEFACGLSLLTGVLFGVAPAWIAAQAGPIDAVRNSRRTTAASASVLQRGLVVVQVGLSLVLLVVAGLFLQSLKKLEGTDLKLDARNRYIVHINPQTAGYTQIQLEALYRTMEERFHALPGVMKVGIASYTPMEDNNNGWGVQVQGQPFLNVGASVIRANAEYFDSVGTRVVMGRGINARDSPASTTVAVVNQTFVKDLFKPGENPIGRHFGHPGPDSTGDFEIVGVVEDTVYTSVRKKDHLMYFVPMMQRPRSAKAPIEKDDSLYLGSIVIATDHPMNDMENIVRATLAAINPNLTVAQLQTFNEQIADRFTEERMVSRLSTLFGALALLLAIIGLYGVTAYSVVRRTPEIGIRMALGAERGGVIAMVMRGAMMQAALGLAIGIPFALVCVRFVKSQLYEITSADFNVMAGAIVILAVAVFVAGIIPARRAASINPVRALRME
ncbi:MAG TPA: ABC transporter permease [Terracidiphilus sp.]|nr:ABC transporter permease [Terracidiphilus sp.]